MSRSAGAGLKATLAAVPLVAMLPGAALADPGGQSLNLAPVKPKKDKGDITTAATRGVSYRCVNSGTLRRRANSYVMGWCMAGSHIDISSTVITQGWQGGYAHGNYENCGWFSTANGLTPEGLWDRDCGNRTFAENYFANYINVSPADDGAHVPIKKNCDLFANVKPWGVGTVGYDRVDTLNSATDQFFYRYLSKNNNWVLGRWSRNWGKPYYDWAFVQRDCVGEPALRAATSDIPAP